MTDPAPQDRYESLLAELPSADDLERIADPNERIARAAALATAGRVATKVRDDALMAALADGASQSEMGLRTGISSAQMARYARRAGIAPRGAKTAEAAAP